jgi:hypothetical protein
MDTTAEPHTHEESPDAAPSRYHPDRHRKSKIARLSKAIRDQVNTMIQDGVPYLQIIQRLSPDTASLTEDNLSKWRSSGYQDWLRGLHIAEDLQCKHELAQSIIARSADDNAAGQALIQIIAGNLLEFLSETDPARLRESLLSDADKFTRFLNAMVRVADGGIRCELHKYRKAARPAKAGNVSGTADRPGISDESLQTAEGKLNLL